MKIEQSKRPDAQDHRFLMFWAADCAEHVLPFFEEKHPEDDRPRKAIEAGRAWARGEIACGAARAAAVAAHAAARAADDGSARAVARAAGHAAGTAHMAGHARHAAAYAVTAAAIATGRGWQYRRLQERLRPVVFPAGSGRWAWPLAKESTMKISSACTRWLILRKLGSLSVWVVLLATVASGCKSWQAESDQNWKQYNPDWKSPTPEDPRPQWGPFARP